MWLNTKDDHKLSLKQYYIILCHVDYNHDEADKYIMQSTYKEISNTIKKALENRKPSYNPDYEDCGDRD
ncbi:MAG: hypothetical protein J6T10_04800 [Methanobrevibacter sp.]|nr:hypothetical protein [Methanobrevibacter sp.]MBP5470140.1 hypothetical protein [Candidatus Riflebacteria bacterium]